MNERSTIKIEPGKVKELSYYPNPETGTTEYRRLLIVDTNASYILQVGTPEYVWSIKMQNGGTTDPNLMLDENIFVMANLKNLQQVVERLQQFPPGSIAPFLEELENPDPAA